MALADKFALAIQEDGSALIEPSGKFHAVPYWDHHRYALMYLGTSIENLLARGFIHTSGGYIFNTKSITQSQIDTLFDWLTYMQENVSSQQLNDHPLATLFNGIQNLIQVSV